MTQAGTTSKSRVRAVLLAITLLAAAAFGSRWVGQGRVHRPNGSANLGVCIGVNRTNRPWVCWMRSRADSTARWTCWSGDSWTTDRGIVPDPPRQLYAAPRSICFDDQGRVWVAWGNQYEDNTHDVASSRWNDSVWDPQTQINQPDSTDLDFAPVIACGGGQVWCVWYGGPTDMSPYSVYASRWNEDTGRWEDETQVSPADGNRHWFCDGAVDSRGTPHVVWCTYPLYTVFYSYFDGSRWADPIAVNDTTLVTASPRADPHIVIDRDGTMHLCFTGAKVGAMRRDIFYTYDDGSGWAPCQMVTRDSLYHEWYSDIAADKRDNVWVVWDRQNEGTDEFRVYASHFDGEQWSAEERLDNDSAYYDRGAALALDAGGRPWVVWIAKTYTGGSFDIYFSRYVPQSPVTETGSGPPAKPTLSVHAAMTGRGEVRLVYETPCGGGVRLDIYNPLGRSVVHIVETHSAAGLYSAEWNGRILNGRPAPAGSYFCRLRAGEMTATCSFVLPSR